jgi:hypothetical protein
VTIHFTLRHKTLTEGLAEFSSGAMSEKIFWPYSHFLLITVLSGFLGDYLPYKVKLCSYKAKFCSYKVISGLAIAL